MSTPEYFVDALLSSCVLALTASGVIGRDSPEFQDWIHRSTHDLGAESEGSALQLSVNAPFVNPALVLEDTRRVSELARAASMKGVVVLIDQAELFEDARVVFQTLQALMESQRYWTFVIAGVPDVKNEIQESHRSLLDKLEILTLEPLVTMGQLRTLLTLPLSTDTERRAYLPAAAVRDVGYATDGQPRLVKLIGSLAWDVFNEADPDARLEITTEVLDRFIQARSEEFDDESLPEALSDISEFADAAKELTDAELRLTDPLVAMEDFTLQECALALLAMGGETGDVTVEAAQLESKFDDFVEKLGQDGLLERQGDRFQIRCGGLGRAYLRTEAARRTGDEATRGATCTVSAGRESRPSSRP
jgi:hypothetical protein